MELVAQWMASMPISTEPITYLDKDGKQQTCTKYTVLESVIIDDFSIATTNGTICPPAGMW